MNILRTPVFRRICRTEVLMCLVMLLLPLGLLLRHWFHTAEPSRSFLMPGAAVITTLRLLLMLSLANSLAEAAAADSAFHRAKNWCLMQSVTEAGALLLNVTLVVLHTQRENGAALRFWLMAGCYLCYVFVLQLFDYLSNRNLMLGLRSVWRLCGGDASLERQLRLTHVLLILSCVLFVPLYMTYSMQDITLRPLMRAIADCAMVLIVIVQLRMALHARKTAVLLAALSE